MNNILTRHIIATTRCTYCCGTNSIIQRFYSIRATFSASSSSSLSSSIRRRHHHDSSPILHHSTSLTTVASLTISPLTPLLFRRSMFIQTQSTPNANSLKFLPGREVLPSNTSSSYDFSSYREAAKVSPLAAAIFSIDGVRSVYLASEFISINIEEGRDWMIIKPEVYAVIMDFYASGKPVLLDTQNDDGSSGAPISSTTILPTDSEVVSMIKELIETRIRPAVQEDGGDIDYKSFDETTGKVLVQMQGSCKGCSSSAITLKNGIENMLMHYVPEVKSVEEYVDEEVASVSEEALKKLEDKLAKVTPIPKASPV